MSSGSVATSRHICWSVRPAVSVCVLVSLFQANVATAAVPVLWPRVRCAWLLRELSSARDSRAPPAFRATYPAGLGDLGAGAATAASPDSPDAPPHSTPLACLSCGLLSARSTCAAHGAGCGSHGVWLNVRRCVARFVAPPAASH